MKEVPLAYVKMNQIGIVLFTAAALLLQSSWPIALLWAIQLAGLLSEGRWNVFVRFARLLLRPDPARTQAAQLQRFNNTLAVLFLTLSMLGFVFGQPVVGYVFAGLLLAAAGAALAGYCVGCTLYWNYKRLRHKYGTWIK